VKEADALHEAGYDVRVVAANLTPEIARLDRSILQRAPWRATLVEGAPALMRYPLRSIQELLRLGFARADLGLWAASHAFTTFSRRLAAAAVREPADLYIAHYTTALIAAADAARRLGARLGFDAEDDHPGEIIPSAKAKADLRIIGRIERTLLPRCVHRTAASPGIAAAYCNRYGTHFEPILNVFPRAMAPAQPQRRPSAVLSVYWFSQTVGPGRGLEDIVAAIGMMKAPVRLTLRGSRDLGYSEHLRMLAAKAGCLDRIEFLDQSDPDKMATLAADHDVGLSIEPRIRPNNEICLGNKIFTYLLAGIPVLLSDTPAQRALAGELGIAAQVVDLGQPAAIARVLDAYAENPDALQAAKQHAWHLGQTRFNWDREKQLLLKSVARALD
jgi:glycosyltransferase involved in cell wall biosynthesis